MSPASQGGVEVERYIGSCLIASTVRTGTHKPIVGKKYEPVIRGKSRSCCGGQPIYPNDTEQCHYGSGGWTGSPLISMTSGTRRCNQRSPLSSSFSGQQQGQQSPPPPQTCDALTHLHNNNNNKNPLSRLAIHTQGAPLILAGRFHNRATKLHCNNGNVNGVANTMNGYVHGNCSTMSNNPRCPPTRPQRPIEIAKKQQSSSKSYDCGTNKETTNNGTVGNNIANIDSLSIASDESSGSNNSENSLPRIIKPRKRRKKDRKPVNNVVNSPETTKHEEQQQQQQQHQHQQQNSNVFVEQSNANSSKSHVPVCYDPRYDVTPVHLRNHRRPPVSRENEYGCRTTVQEIATDGRQRYPPHRHVEVKVLDDNRNVVMSGQMRAAGPPNCYGPSGHHQHNMSNNYPRYNIHEYHDSNGIVHCEDGLNDGLRSCQCRYCDPAALIWDVDQSSYSPYLTPSPSTEFCPSHYSQMLYLSRPNLDCPEQSIDRLFVNNSPARNQRGKPDISGNPGIVLRRSWSDPTNYFSEEISAPSKDVGVIGDRGQTESGKRRTLWRGESIGIPTREVESNVTDVNGTVQSSKGLEVSTEIITSPNGHRDLEIRFYSPSPNAPQPDEEKVGCCTEEADEDEEDFSDIWSYHESKLQQDFRTLLQAEE